MAEEERRRVGKEEEEWGPVDSDLTRSDCLGPGFKTLGITHRKEPCS